MFGLYNNILNEYEVYFISIQISHNLCKGRISIGHTYIVIDYLIPELPAIGSAACNSTSLTELEPGSFISIHFVHKNTAHLKASPFSLLIIWLTNHNDCMDCPNFPPFRLTYQDYVGFSSVTAIYLGIYMK